jgi:hypothetical protein
MESRTLKFAGCSVPAVPLSCRQRASVISGALTTQRARTSKAGTPEAPLQQQQQEQPSSSQWAWASITGLKLQWPVSSPPELQAQPQQPQVGFEASATHYWPC